MHERKKINPWILFSLFLLFFTIALFGYLYYNWQLNKFKDGKKNELAAIAYLKVKQITDWREERLSDIRYLNRVQEIPDLIRKAEINQNAKSVLKRLHDIIFPIYQNQRYVGIHIFDTQGKHLFAVSESTHVHYLEVYKQFERVKKINSPVISELELHDNNQIVLHLTSAVRNSEGILIGYVVLCVDPYRELYPLIQNWPIPSKTSESLVIKRDGDSVLYVNELRHRKGTALKMRLPISDEMLQAAMAVQGIEGVVEGRDYRGVEVLAAIRSIPNSSWFLVAKTDIDEVYAPIFENRWLIVIVGLLFLLSLGFSIATYWFRREMIIKERLFEAEREKKALLKHFDYLFKYANDIILLTNSEWRIIEANERAFDIYGYTKEELLNFCIYELRPVELRKHFNQVVEKLLLEGSAIYETVHIKKDGTKFPVEVSIRKIEIEGTVFWQAIIRDITLHKEYEKRINNLNYVYGLLSQVNQAIVRSKQRDELLKKLCEIAVEYGKFKMAWLGLIDNRSNKFVSVEAYGSGAEFINNFISDRSKANDPISRALNERTVIFYNDIEKNIELVWKDEALKYGFKSFVVMPLLLRNEAVGVFTIFSEQKEFFTKEEIALFDEVTADISYALEYFEREKEKREVEEKYRKLYESMMDGYVLTDMRGNILEFNETYRKMLGYEESELNNMTYIELTPDNWHKFESEIVENQILKQGYSDIYEKEYRKKDGTVFPVELHTFLLKNEKGEPTGMWAIVRDITERKKVEEELKKYREHLEDLVKERTAELEHLNEVFVDREIRMNELKERIAELEKRARK